jgi:hypothetical protein
MAAYRPVESTRTAARQSPSTRTQAHISATYLECGGRECDQRKQQQHDPPPPVEPDIWWKDVVSRERTAIQTQRNLSGSAPSDTDTQRRKTNIDACTFTYARSPQTTHRCSQAQIHAHSQTLTDTQHTYKHSLSLSPSGILSWPHTHSFTQNKPDGAEDGASERCESPLALICTLPFVGTSPSSAFVIASSNRSPTLGDAYNSAWRSASVW